MKNIKNLLFLLIFGALFFACETEMVDTVDTFNLPNGGYMRIVTPFPFGSGTVRINRKNLAGTRMEVVHEAVTPNSGANFTSYDLEIRYAGATTTAYKAFRSIPASAYTKDPTTGYPRHTLVVTGAEAMTAMGLDTNTVKAGHKFEIKGTMKLSDGKSFTFTNTGANITGGAFYQSPFFYVMNMID